MSIQYTDIKSSEQWHSLRRGVIGASETGALFGVHDYLSYWTLYQKKRGMLPETADDGAMERGRRLEPVALDMLRDRYPEWGVHAPKKHYAEHEFGVGATPDAFATDPVRGGGLLQIKSVAPSAFRQNWRGDSDAVQPPLWIALQAMQEAWLTGARWAAVVALVVDHEIDLHVIEVPVRPDVIEKIKDAALTFWKRVLEGREPEPDYGRDGEAIRKVLREDDGGEIDLSADNEIYGLVAQRATVKALVAEYEYEAKAIDAQLLHKLGNAAVGRFNGGTISAKTIHRAAYQVKASQYRQLRVTRSAP